MKGRYSNGHIGWDIVLGLKAIGNGEQANINVRTTMATAIYDEI
jgi:hypothetical protein